MTYRDWREITKKLLGAKGPVREVSIPKSKLRRPESHLYLKWVRDEIIRDRRQFAGYNNGTGIIATRERFLQWLTTHNSGSRENPDQMVESMQGLANDENRSGQQKRVFGKTVIVPVAIPGSGRCWSLSILTHADIYFRENSSISGVETSVRFRPRPERRHSGKETGTFILEECRR